MIINNKHLLLKLKSFSENKNFLRREIDPSYRSYVIKKEKATRKRFNDVKCIFETLN